MLLLLSFFEHLLNVKYKNTHRTTIYLITIIWCYYTIVYYFRHVCMFVCECLVICQLSPLFASTSSNWKDVSTLFHTHLQPQNCCVKSVCLIWSTMRSFNFRFANWFLHICIFGSSFFLLHQHQTPCCHVLHDTYILDWYQPDLEIN